VTFKDLLKLVHRLSESNIQEIKLEKKRKK
jgi:hypothetical protein